METENKYSIVLLVTFNEGGMQMPEFKEYSERATANIEAFGGETVEKYMIEKNMEGGEAPQMVAVINFPSREKADAALSTEEYQNLIPLRNVVFKEIRTLITK